MNKTLATKLKKKKKTTKLSLIPDGRGKLVLSKNDLGYFRIGS